MRLLIKNTKRAVLFCLVTCAFVGHAQVKKQGEEKAESKSSVEDSAAAKERSAIERFKEPPLKPITDLERKQACQKYESKYISSYGLVYFVKKCKRYELDADEVSQMTRKNVHFREVDQRVIAALEEGTTFDELNKKKFNCQRFNNALVDYDLVTYRAKNCTLQEFPDDPTLQEYRRKNQLQGKPIVSLTHDEFVQFKVGDPMLSILKDTIEDSPLTIIPMKDVCRNLVGKRVSYLDTIYLINRSKNGKDCWKKSLEADTYTRKAGKTPKMQELSSSQALSIPDSDPSLNPPAKPKVQ